MSDPAKLLRTQELVYEMSVSEVMTRNVVTVAPETSMQELRDILRTNRISGAPVISEKQLVGIISIEDFINWLASGSPSATVGEKMTREVVTVFDDEPLVLLVNRLDRHGYGRLPVLRRSGRTLTGVVTKGDIVAGLMRELEIGQYEEETRRFRASHIFEDIVADQAAVVLQYRVVGGDFEQAGRGATRLKNTLRRMGINPQALRRAAIIAYEAEMNIVIYTEGGELVARVEPGVITLEAKDDGPGIADVEMALTPGYSTAADWVRELGFGAGMGLCNIKKCADEMTLDSTVGEGTRVQAKIVV